MGLTGFSMDGYGVPNTNNEFTGMLGGNGRDMVNDPFIKGYAFIRWTKLPKWVTDAYKQAAEFMEANFMEFSGLSDMEMSTETVPSGFNANEYHVAGGMQKQNTDFSLKFTEWSGSPVRAMFQYWVSGIRDPETGLATYVAVNDGKYGAQHHTGEMLYVVTRPDAHNVGGNNIEFACYYTNVMPTRIPLSHLTYSQGDRGKVELDIPFKANFHMSPKIDAFATKVLGETMFKYKSLGDYERIGTSLTRKP